MMVALCLLVILPILIMTVTYLRLFRLVKMRCQPAAIGARSGHCGATEMSNATGSQQTGGAHPNGRVGPSGSTAPQSNGDGKAIVPDAPSVFGATTAPNKILVRQQRLMQGPPDLRIAITLLILLGVFILCWTPAIILSIAGATGRRELFHPITFVVVTICFMIVPACNPVVYSLRNSQFRAAANEFLESIGAMCGKKNT
ncbi:5-hydroxytryptamine receptor 1B-like [Amphiura filiformis]|uniref:5-hydroxytryptamine receptor 1B-like n=1 Tax=Amphiura filiformis TaxID=82378 RepID=UPI003B21F71E